jgi:hypothetical protein
VWRALLLALTLTALVTGSAEAASVRDAHGDTAAVVIARNPRLEQLALTPADTRRAEHGLLKLADLSALPPGWRPLSTSPDASGPVCPWQDYSYFTLTGRGEADFQPTKVGSAGFVGSSVELFSSSSQASGKFTIDIHPGTVGCESSALKKALGPGLKIVSARALALPGLGERSVDYAFEYAVVGQSRTIYVNIVEFVRGSAVGMLETTNFNDAGNVSTRLRLAQTMDMRLR